VGFSKAIKLPDFELYPEFKNPKLMRQNCTNSTNNSALCKSRRLQTAPLTPAEIKQQAIDISNLGLVVVNNTLQPVLQLHMLPGTETDPHFLNFTWTCVNFEPMYMDFQLNYTRYMNVSVHDFKDALQVNFVGHQYYRSASDFEYIE
jgi:hypothetical protein